MALTLKLRRDHVMVKVLEGERVRPSGVILPEQPYDFNKKSDAGTRAYVIALSNWFHHEVEVGDIVIIEKFGGIELTLGGVEVVILSSNEILAIVENDDTPWVGKTIQMDGAFIANKRILWEQDNA